MIRVSAPRNHEGTGTDTRVRLMSYRNTSEERVRVRGPRIVRGEEGQVEERRRASSSIIDHVCARTILVSGLQ